MPRLRTVSAVLAAVLLLGPSTVSSQPGWTIPHDQPTQIGRALSAEYAVVMFSMDGCQACRELLPEMDRFARISGTRGIPTSWLYFSVIENPPFDFLPVMADGTRVLSATIDAFPTVVMFHDGVEVDRGIGYDINVLQRVAEFSFRAEVDLASRP